MSAAIDKQAKNWRWWVAPVLSATILAAVLLVVHREFEHFQLRDVLDYLRRIPTAALLAAAACTVASYVLLGFFDVAALRYVGKQLPYRRVAVSSFIAYAVANNAGAAALTGGAMRLRLYTSQKLTGTEVATLQGFCSMTSGIGIATLIGLSLLVAGDRAATALYLLPPWSWICGLLLLGGIAAYAAWATASRHGIEFRGWTLRPPGPVLTPLQIALGVVELSVASSVLWWLLPPAADIDLPGFLGIYALAVAAGIISHVPGGVGVFESIILLALPAVPRDELLGALLAYRAIYYLGPLLAAGATFAALELREQRQRIAHVESFFAAYVAQVAPQIVGSLVLLAGVMLLVSGATPAVSSRLTALRHLVPLPILEASHLAGSVCGVGLLVLARACFAACRKATDWR